MKKLSTRIQACLEVNFLFKNIFVPIALLTFYCGSFAYLASRYLTNGVNLNFATRSFKYLLIPLAVVYLILLVIFFLKRGQFLSFNKAAVNGRISDLIFLLIPLTTIVQFMIDNKGILSGQEALSVLGFFVILIFIYLYVIPALIGIFSSMRTLMAIGLAFMVTIINMALLTDNFGWLEKGSLKIQWVFLGAMLIVSWILINTKNQKLITLVVLVFFIANSSVQFVLNYQVEWSRSVPAGKITLRQMAEAKRPVTTPNIYLLIYDAYVSNETMSSYGIDNSGQEEYLSDLGFVLYPHTYSVGGITLTSMSRVLDASAEYYGRIRKSLSGDGIVQNTLHDLGYTTYGIFPYDYMFQQFDSSYDFSYPKQEVQSNKLLISAILIGEFRFDLSYQQQTHTEFVDTKQKIFANIPEDRIFVYMHTTIPNHSQNSGKCLPDEIEKYKERLSSANNEMQQDIGLIMNNDPGAIIIVAGDHGPYLTKNCYNTSGEYGNYDISEISRLDIQDRFGAFLAIKWPTTEYKKYDDITVLQDLFPVIFAYLYDDAEFLSLKIQPDISNPVETIRISGASVKNGIIVGGINDGEPLFLSDQ